MIRMFQVANGYCHRLSSLDGMIGRSIPLSTWARAGCGIDANNKSRKLVFTEIQFAHLISMTLCVFTRAQQTWWAKASTLSRIHDHKQTHHNQ